MAHRRLVYTYNMGPSRTRYSLEYIQNLYDTGQDRSKLENLIRAFRGIQALDPKDPNSFFRIAGYHGEPFRGEGATDPSWWGGYCWHATVLFPTWHRAYLLRLENALRSIPGCQDVTLPFWDELANRGAKPARPIPSVLTSLGSTSTAEMTIRSTRTSSRKPWEGGWGSALQQTRGLRDCLVGTDRDRKETKAHNAGFQDQAITTQILNDNVANWLEGTVEITIDDKDKPTPMPDTYSVYARYLRCLQAPNYTVFSNTTSQNQWIKDAGQDPSSHYVVSLESPHNAKGVYNANPILGANGDMGNNETAGFDPVFYFHHCYIDYVFAVWQRAKGLTKRGSLTLIKNYPGTILKEGQPHYPSGTVIEMTTALIPFEKPSGGYYDSNDMTDYENDLDYTYHLGSLDPTLRSTIDLSTRAPFVLTKRVHDIDRAQYEGSFIVRLYARGHDGKEVEVGREPVLSRWSVKGCSNCMNNLNVESYIPIDATLLKTLQGPGRKEDIEWWAEVQTRDRLRAPRPIGGPAEVMNQRGPSKGEL
ncbi:hypothetical protein D9756_002723 [Leucocoprinus leucothites]|uniref:tyrosinase n=1 Tax=Leucocoprinus leucothites TaxID=201217 RepID=A0A8H5GBV2_9AGAR|nr:hypothetical protein D9756_002723 [Leucoagaricus leucothites]